MKTEHRIEQTKKRIIRAAGYFKGKRRVTQVQIARRAGVYKSQVTEYMARYLEVRKAVNEVKIISVKERILLAIEYFKSRGLRANRQQVGRRAKVHHNAVKYWEVRSALVRLGLREIKPLSVKEKILIAIRQLRQEGRYLTRKSICFKSGVSTTAYNFDKNRYSEIRFQLKMGPLPPSVEQRIIDVAENLIRRRIFVNQKEIASLVGVSKQTIIQHKKKPDEDIRRVLQEVSPLSSDQRICLALNRLSLKGQFPSTRNLANQAGLSCSTVLRRMKDNSDLKQKIISARKGFLI